MEVINIPHIYIYIYIYIERERERDFDAIHEVTQFSVPLCALIITFLGMVM